MLSKLDHFIQALIRYNTTYRLAGYLLPKGYYVAWTSVPLVKGHFVQALKNYGEQCGRRPTQAIIQSLVSFQI